MFNAAALPPVPYRTRLMDENGLLNQSIWARWLQTVVRALNQQMPPITVAELPNDPIGGMVLAVSDSATVTWGATVTGGGTHAVLVWWNGAHWTVVGK